MCLCFKKVLKHVILTSLFWGTGREGTAEKRSWMVTMLSILTLDVKLQMLIINKNIYSVLKFTVQREFECSFLISVVGESIVCISKLVK